MVVSDTFFSLLRLALGTSSAEAVELPALTKADWEALADLAFEQGVAAIAVDGLQKAGAPRLEPRDEAGEVGEGLRRR